MNLKEQYWIGKDIDIQQLWSAFENDPGYQHKFSTMSTHLLEIKFDNPKIQLPLFNHEVIFKTLKGLYHDTKQVYLPNEYDNLGPLFLYQVKRSSGIYQLLVEGYPGIIFACLLLGGTDFINKGLISKCLEWWEKIESIRGKKLNNTLISTKAERVKKIQYMVDKLASQGIAQVRMTKEPFSVDGNSEFKDFSELDD